MTGAYCRGIRVPTPSPIVTISIAMAAATSTPTRRTTRQVQVSFSNRLDKNRATDTHPRTRFADPDFYRRLFWSCRCSLVVRSPGHELQMSFLVAKPLSLNRQQHGLEDWFVAHSLSRRGRCRPMHTHKGARPSLRHCRSVASCCSLSDDLNTTPPPGRSGMEFTPSRVSHKQCSHICNR